MCPSHPFHGWGQFGQEVFCLGVPLCSTFMHKDFLSGRWAVVSPPRMYCQSPMNIGWCADHTKITQMLSPTLGHLSDDLMKLWHTVITWWVLTTTMMLTLNGWSCILPYWCLASSSRTTWCTEPMTRCWATPIRRLRCHTLIFTLNTVWPTVRPRTWLLAPPTGGVILALFGSILPGRTHWCHASTSCTTWCTKPMTRCPAIPIRRLRCHTQISQMIQSPSPGGLVDHSQSHQMEKSRSHLRRRSACYPRQSPSRKAV